MKSAPIHLWIVGVMSLLWNSGGVMDYVMTQTKRADYLAAQPAARLSLLGLIVSSIYTYGMAGGGNLAMQARIAAVIFSIAIPVILTGLWIYARAMARAGVLR